MKTKKNEFTKPNNEIYFSKNIKTPINRTNSKLLLFKSDKRTKNALYIKNLNRPNNSNFTDKINFNLHNKQLFDKKLRFKISDEKIINNKRKRPFSSDMNQKTNDYLIKPTILKNHSSMELIENKKSLNEERKNDSLNILIQPYQIIEPNTNSKKLYPFTSLSNNSNSIRFSMNLSNPPTKLHNENIRYMNNNNAKIFNNNINISSKSNTNNIFIQESQKENLPSTPFEQIKSIRNLNILGLQTMKNKSNKNTFRSYPNSRSVNSSPFYRISNKSDTAEESEKNNDNTLIRYKKVFYSSLPNQYNNPSKIKQRQYNEKIRLLNDIKNFKFKERQNNKKYSFYKYEEYMDKIQKEEMKVYQSIQHKKKEINIQEIFQNKSKITKKSQILNNSISKSKSKSKLTNKDELHLSKKSLALSNILSSKNSENNSNNNTARKYIRIQIKKGQEKSNKIYSNETSSEMPIIINDYEVNRTGIRKIRKTNTVVVQNIFLKKFREEQIIFETDPDHANSHEQLSAEVNQIRKQDLLHISDDLEKKKKKNFIDNIKFEKIKSIPMKSPEKKSKEHEIFENLRKNYFIKREKMIKMNRKNLMAQKLLMKKIAEIDKSSEQNKIYSKFSPFHNLNYKYSNEQMNQRKKKILEKYYKKNLDKNKFSVRLKNKSSQSFYTNNNSINGSHIFSQANDLKSEYFSINDYFNNENTQRNQADKEKDIIKINPNENNNILKEIEKIDNQIQFDDNEKEKEEYIKNKEKERLNKIRMDEIILNNMIKEEKKKKFEAEFFKKYDELLKSHEKKERIQKNLITNEMIEETTHYFFNLLQENENIIKTSKKEEDVELFIEFREKMNSLAKFSKNELNLYIFRNYPIINHILEECKRDRQRETRINKFIQLLREDLDEIYNKKNYIQKFIKIMDYQPFPNHASVNS